MRNAGKNNIKFGNSSGFILLKAKVTTNFMIETFLDF